MESEKENPEPSIRTIEQNTIEEACNLYSAQINDCTFERLDLT